MSVQDLLLQFQSSPHVFTLADKLSFAQPQKIQLKNLNGSASQFVAAGLVGSGAALITSTVYNMMFSRPIPDANVSFLPNDEALVKLITDKNIDAVTVAAGQPAPIVANMKPGARALIKFLKFDENHPSTIGASVGINLRLAESATNSASSTLS